MLTKKEREAIHKKLKKNHATALWIYAPGAIDPEKTDNKFSEKNIEALTKIKCEVKNERHDTAYRFCEKTHKLSTNIDKRRIFGKFDKKRIFGLVSQKYDPSSYYDSYVYPTVCPADEESECLAYFLTSGIPSVTVKECGEFTSVLHSAKILSADVLREVARFAGCHIYNEKCDTLYANRNYLCIHSSESEKKTLRFPKPVTLTEVYESKVYADGVTEVDIDMYLGETKMFRTEYK